MTIHSNNLYKDFSSVEFKHRVSYLPRPGGIYGNFFKRLIDVTLAVVGGVLVLPILLVLCLFIARKGGSPIYWSDRVGRDGRIFRMMKLRTMEHEADTKLQSYLDGNSEAAAEWQSTQKLKNDPRITELGTLLRKTSIDELPQLWNVLIGDMSLVGPRPMLPNQRGMYPGRAYYALRPGVTGPWQVSDRNECEFRKRAEFDSDYYETLSLRSDVDLLFRTVSVVVSATGH